MKLEPGDQSFFNPARLHGDPLCRLLLLCSLNEVHRRNVLGKDFHVYASVVESGPSCWFHESEGILIAASGWSKVDLASLRNLIGPLVKGEVNNREGQLVSRTGYTGAFVLPVSSFQRWPL